MNDNPAPNPVDKLIGSVLAKSVVIEEHLSKGLPAMLNASGITPEFQSVVTAFMSPLVAIVGELEREVIQFTRNNVKPLKAELLRAEVEFFADEFSRFARTPAQMKLAAKLREFAQELTGKEPENSMEKGIDLDR